MTSQEAVALATHLEHPISLAFALCQLGILHIMRREPERLHECSVQALEFAEQIGFPTYVGMAAVGRGWARAMTGEGEEGVAEIQRGLGIIAQIGAGIGAPGVLAVLRAPTLRARR